MKEIFQKKLNILEKKIGHTFENIEHLKNALTHSSYANDTKNKDIVSNERLEFLGDAVLSMVISEYLYINCPKLPEGELTKIRSNVVCAVTLAKYSRELEIGEFMLLGKSEIVSGGKNRDSILADAFEAVIGAIFIDSGIEGAKKFIIAFLEEAVKSTLSGNVFMDFKTQLQEIVQKTDEKVEYSIVDEKGPDHNKVFAANVKIGVQVLGSGIGKTKKEAEQNAARQAIEVLLQGEKEKKI